MGVAHSVLPAPPVSIDRLGTALDNLALAAANDTTVLQQLTAANLALTTSNATLTAANKKLSEALAKVPATTPQSSRYTWCTSGAQQTLSWELLLDSWPSYQRAAHECNVR